MPNVFIGGKHIGGCDSKATPTTAASPFSAKQNVVIVLFFFTVYMTFYHLFLAAVLEKHRAGQLVPLLNAAGAIANNSAQL